MAEAFVSSTRLAELTQQLAAGTPMSPIYIAPEDSVRVHLLNSHPASLFQFGGRLLRADGVTVPLMQELLKRTDGIAAATVITLAEGYFLSAVVAPVGDFVQRGQCFAMIDLIRGQTAGSATFALLASGYVSSLQPLMWPWGVRNESEVDGPGWIQTVTGNNTPGAAFTYTIPANRSAILRSVSWGATTSAAAGDRTFNVSVTRAGVLVFATIAAAVQAPSVTNAYTAAIGITTRMLTPGTYQELSLPVGIRLNPGDVISITAAGLLGGDLIQGVLMQLESYVSWFA